MQCRNASHLLAKFNRFRGDFVNLSQQYKKTESKAAESLISLIDCPDSQLEAVKAIRKVLTSDSDPPTEFIAR